MGGLLTLGGYKSQFFTGDIAWNNVTVQDYWQIGMDSMSVEGRRGTIACDRVSWWFGLNFLAFVNLFATKDVWILKPQHTMSLLT